MNLTANGLISRGEEPLNLEMPFSSIETFLTPNERFYVRCHFPIPEIRVADWRLRVEGSVSDPLEFSYRALQELPSHTITTTMECAGNGRSFLQPEVKGVAWESGAVGNAQWTGVFLSEVLQRARLERNAIEVILEGADRGAIKEPPRPPGDINYARSLPVGKAADDVLLAWEMNGEALSPAHGFPLRAVVPGWFGMASVKWLQRIVVTATPFHGYYQSIDYAYWEHRSQLAALKPLREMQVKAQIARPGAGEVLNRGVQYRVHGAAWAGLDPVAGVELSHNGGRAWEEARLLGLPVKNAWRLWEFPWRTPEAPGTYTLIARAIDSAGRTQPMNRVAEFGSYVVNHWLPIHVEVK